MKTLQALRLLQSKTNAEVFLVGGFVRDYLRNKKNDDLDIVIRKISSKAIVTFLKPHGGCKIVTLAINNDSFATELILFRAHQDNKIAQIVLPRKGKRQIAHKNNTLRQDAKYRDFKINAMYLPINFKSKSDVIDMVGGIKDIKKRTISCVGKSFDCFSMSPIRVMRILSLAAHTGYKIENELFSAIGKYASSLSEVPPEAIRKELNKILLCKKPSRYLRLMSRLGVLKFVMPELNACVGVKQDPRYHKYDVFNHCIYTCDNTEPDLILRLSGLLHDVGKPKTKKKIGKKITFHKHEMMSVKLARQFLNRLRYDGKTKSSILNLIRLHMYHYTREYGDGAVRRFIKKVNLTEDMLETIGDLPLFKLRKAERLGNGLKTNPVTKRQLDFEKRIKKIFVAGGGLTLKDLKIDGNVIQEIFNIKAGKEIGEALNYLLSQVQQNKKLNNRLELIELALMYFKKKENYMDNSVR